MPRSSLRGLEKRWSKRSRSEGKREREKTWPPSRHLIFRGEGRKVLQTLLFENWIRTSVNGKREGVLSFGHALTENIPCDAKPQRGDYAVRPLIRVYAIAKLPPRILQPQLRDTTTDVDQAGTPFRSAFPDTISIGILSLPFPSTDGRTLLRWSKLVPLLFFQYLNWFSNKFWILYDATIVSSVYETWTLKVLYILNSIFESTNIGRGLIDIWFNII